MGPNGSRSFHSSCYDVYASRPKLSIERTASTAAVLLLDGLFLHAPALEHCFDFTIFISAEFELCLRRALALSLATRSDLTISPSLRRSTVRNTSPGSNSIAGKLRRANEPQP